MEILTEFDELQAALAKVNMDESVFPYVNGRLVESESFNKTQKILNCPEMISAHKYLYNLDLDQLTEEDVNKIDQLYKLGCDRGFIIDDLTKWDNDGNEFEDTEVEVDEVPEVKPQNTLFKAKIPCWTVIYSATKDGDIKTGEAYSNAVSINAAKADVNAKLSQCGYDNITILAIENCTTAPVCQCQCQTAQDISEKDKAEKEDNDADTENDSEDDASDDTESSDDADDTDETSDEDADETSDEKSDEDTDETSDETSDEDTEDEESDEESEDTSDDSDDEGSDDTSDDEDKDNGDDEDASDDDELSANEKAELKDLYRKTFKNTLVKCKFDTSFNDLTLQQKVKFFTELAKTWTKDNEPQEFMTDKELEQLDNVVAYVNDADDNADEDDDSSDED